MVTKILTAIFLVGFYVREFIKYSLDSLLGYLTTAIDHISFWLMDQAVKLSSDSLLFDLIPRVAAFLFWRKISLYRLQHYLAPPILKDFFEQLIDVQISYNTGELAEQRYHEKLQDLEDYVNNISEGLDHGAIHG